MHLQGQRNEATIRPATASVSGSRYQIKPPTRPATASVARHRESSALGPPARPAEVASQRGAKDRPGSARPVVVTTPCDSNDPIADPVAIHGAWWRPRSAPTGSPRRRPRAAEQWPRVDESMSVGRQAYGVPAHAARRVPPRSGTPVEDVGAADDGMRSDSISATDCRAGAGVSEPAADVEEQAAVIRVRVVQHGEASGPLCALTPDGSSGYMTAPADAAVTGLQDVRPEPPGVRLPPDVLPLYELPPAAAGRSDGRSNNGRRPSGARTSAVQPLAAP